MTTYRLTIAVMAVLSVVKMAHADDIANLKADVAALKNLLGNHQIALDGIATRQDMVSKKTQFIAVTGKTMKIQGCNVQLTNADVPSFPNGLGNLTIGFNRTRLFDTNDRSGSAFLIVGDYNNFSGNGGFVSGGGNDCGQNTVILSGYANTSVGMYSVILTGENNKTDGYQSLIGTGRANWLGSTAYDSSILGGQNNEVWGVHSTILTGLYNSIKGQVKYGLIGTGDNNTILLSNYSAIMTGSQNTIYSTGMHNVIGSGLSNGVRADCEGVFLANGNAINVYKDYRHDANGVTWVDRLMSEGKVFRN